MNNKRYQLSKKYYLISLIKSAIMLQKFLVYTTLWILFQLLIEINCQMIPSSQEYDKDILQRLFTSEV